MTVKFDDLFESIKMSNCHDNPRKKKFLRLYFFIPFIIIL